MARSIQSLERAAAVLRLLAGDEPRQGLSAIASAVGLAKATTHGLLRTLQREGLVEQDPLTGKYQLGAELLRLGASYLGVHELRARALAWTDELARDTDENAYVGVLHQRGVLIVHHAFRPGDSRQALEVGSVQPLHSTALGKALAAHDPAARDEVRAVGLRAITELTVTDPVEFDQGLELIRARGWASDVGESWEGVASIAAPVVDRRRLPVGAVGIVGAVERLQSDGHALRPRLIAAVRDCARAVSRDLGAGRF